MYGIHAVDIVFIIVYAIKHNVSSMT